MADESLTDVNWEDYYQKLQGREIRPLLINALEYFAAEPAKQERQAIELGFGDGTESAWLIKNGWHVLAIDAEPKAASHLLAKIPPVHQARLQTQIAKFEDVVLIPSDLIFASYSIPFCQPKHFNQLWQKIEDSLISGGRFAGQFFGVNDTWANSPDMTFQTQDQVRAMLQNFDIEFFHEQDEDGQAVSGPKHWHVFSVIAKKN